MGFERHGDASEVAALQVVEAEGVGPGSFDELGDDGGVARVDGVGVKGVGRAEKGVEQLVRAHPGPVDEVGESGDDRFDGRLGEAREPGGVADEL